MTVILAWIAVVSLVWAPFFWCCCGPATCTTVVTITVRGCNSATVAGATVEIRSGLTLLTSGTTDGSGVVVLSATTTFPLSVSLRVLSYCGYALLTQSTTLNCSPISTTLTLSPLGTHVCVPCCDWPIPRTLNVGTPLGTTTVTYVSGDTWNTLAYFTVPRASLGSTTCSCGGGGTSSCTVLTTSNASTLFLIEVRCTGSAWELVVSGTIQYERTACTGSPGFGFIDITPPSGYQASVQTAATLTGTCACNTFALSGTLPDLTDIDVETELCQICCGTPGPPPATCAISPTWGFAGTVTADD
jgi:hypothetical protein